MRFLGFHRLAVGSSVRGPRRVRPGIARRFAGRSERFRVTAFERPDTAVIVRQRLLENAEDVDALFVLAALHARDGSVAEGITVLDHVLRLDPAYPGAWRFKATLHRMRGENDAMRSAWQRAEDVEP
jgi:Flp pilus assembly protein TadD